MPNPLVRLKIRRWKVKEKEQDLSLMLQAGPGQWGSWVSVDIFSDGSFMLDLLLKPPSWAVGSKLICVPISKDGQGFRPRVALEAPCWVLLSGRLLGLLASRMTQLRFLAAASASKQGQGSGVGFSAQSTGRQSLAPAWALSGPVSGAGEGSGARRASHLWLSFSWVETKVWKARNCRSVPRGFFKVV